MNVRVHRVQGQWLDVDSVYTWSVQEGALVLHQLNPAPEPPKTGVEFLAVFAPEQWSYVEAR